MTEWQKGDVMILRLDKFTHPDTQKAFRETFAELFPGVTIVTTTGLEGIDVLHKK